MLTFRQELHRLIAGRRFERMTLVHCPTFSFDAFSLETARNCGYYAYPPVGLQCLKTAVEAETEVKVEIIDLNFFCLRRLRVEGGDPHEMLRELLDESFFGKPEQIIGVSAGVIVSNIFGVENHPFVQVLEHAMRNGHIVVAGGVIATNERQNILDKSLVHFIVEGEAEERLIFFVKSILGIPAVEVPGIYFAGGQTSGANQSVDFRWNLIPTYDQVPVETYHEVGSLSPFSRMIGPEKPYGTVQFNRGCRAHCSFCGVTPFMGKGVRSYSEDAVIAEIRHLALDRDVKHLELLDDDFLRYRGAALRLLETLSAQNLGLTWAANNGLIATSLDEEVLRAMVRSGCVGFRIGIESGNDEMLKRIRKPATKKSLRAAGKLLQNFPEVFVVGCYIVGFEGETYRQMLDTLRLCVELDLSWSGFSVYQIIRDSTDVSEEFEYKVINDFVPPKENANGVIAKESANVFDLFINHLDEVHNKESLAEIWFAFNLIANYLCNKGLREGENVEHFIRWIESLRMTHPNNPVMSLFLALGYIIVGDRTKADDYYVKTLRILRESGYWLQRFHRYSLRWIVESYPMNADGVREVLIAVMNNYELNLREEPVWT